MVGAVVRSQGPECHPEEGGIQKILSMDGGCGQTDGQRWVGEDGHSNGCVGEQMATDREMTRQTIRSMEVWVEIQAGG